MRFILFLVSLCLSVAISLALESGPAAGACGAPSLPGTPGDSAGTPAAPSEGEP